jgi:hypothetical protein
MRTIVMTFCKLNLFLLVFLQPYKFYEANSGSIERMEHTFLKANLPYIKNGNISVCLSNVTQVFNLNSDATSCRK